MPARAGKRPWTDRTGYPQGLGPVFAPRPTSKVFSHGTGSELRQPLGYAMVGGLAVSQALTLFTTPVIYIYLERLQQWLTGKRPRAVVVQEAAVEAPWSEQPAE